MSSISKLWKIVKYTMIEATNKKSFIKTNILILAIIIAIGPCVALFKSSAKEEKSDSAKNAKEFNNDIGIDAIQIYYDDACAAIDYSGIKNNSTYMWMNLEQENVASYDIENKVKELKGTNTLVVKVYYDNAYMVNAYIPKDSDITEDEASKAVKEFENIINTYKYASIYANEGEILEINKEYNVDISTIGQKEESIILELVQQILPVFFSVAMFMIVFMYSKNITTSLSTERNSKIIELLTSYARPKTLIRGKLIGNVLVGFAQIGSFIIAIVMSVVLGNKVSNNMTGKDLVDVDKFISYLRLENGENAFTVNAIVISIVLLILSIVFFDVLAGICGTFVGKPEDSSVVSTLYTYIIMIGYFVSLMSVSSDNETLKSMLKYVPFCIPYKMPADVLVGNVTMQEGLISMLIMIVCSVGVYILMGHIYEKLVFKSFSLKEILKKLKRA